MDRNRSFLDKNYTTADVMGYHICREVSYDVIKPILEEHIQKRFKLSDGEARRKFDPLRTVFGTTRAYCRALSELEWKISQERCQNE